MHFNVRFEDDFSFIFGIKINSMTSMVYRGRSGGRFVIQKLVFENMFCDLTFADFQNKSSKIGHHLKK